MRVLIDTNVVLDLMLAREPWDVPAARLFALADDGVIEGYVCATSVTTVCYLARRMVGGRAVLSLVRTVLEFLSVAAVDTAVLERALNSEASDFEDAVVLEAARAVGAEGIVTRDKRGFGDSDLSVWSPDELLAMVDVLTDHVEIVSL